MVAQAAQKLVARQAAAEVAARRAAAGDDELVDRVFFLRGFEEEAAFGLFYLCDLGAKMQLDILAHQGKAQHVHHGVGLVGIGIDPTARLCNGVQTQGLEKVKGGGHGVFF